MAIKSETFKIKWKKYKIQWKLNTEKQVSLFKWKIVQWPFDSLPKKKKHFTAITYNGIDCVSVCKWVQIISETNLCVDQSDKGSCHWLWMVDEETHTHYRPILIGTRHGIKCCCCCWLTLIVCLINSLNLNVAIYRCQGGEIADTHIDIYTHTV